MVKTIFAVVNATVHAAYYLVRDTARAVYDQARDCIAEIKDHRHLFRFEKKAKLRADLKVIARGALIFAGAIAYTVITGVAQGVLAGVHDTLDYVYASCAKGAEFEIVEDEASCDVVDDTDTDNEAEAV